MGLAGHADIPTVQNQPVVGYRKQFGRKTFDQLLFGLQWIFGSSREPNAVRNSKNMSVNRHRLFTESHDSHHIGRFAPDTRQSLQLVDIRRYNPTKLTAKHPRHR